MIDSKKSSRRNRSQRQNELSQGFAKRLRQARLNISLSQEALGKALEVSFQMVQKYEKGDCQMTPAQVVIAAENLKIPLIYLLTGQMEDGKELPSVSVIQLKSNMLERQKEFEKSTDPQTGKVAKQLMTAWLSLTDPLKVQNTTS